MKYWIVWIFVVYPLRKVVWIFMKLSGRSEPQVPSRCANRSIRGLLKLGPATVRIWMVLKRFWSPYSLIYRYLKRDIQVTKTRSYLGGQGVWKRAEPWRGLSHWLRRATSWAKDRLEYGRYRFHGSRMGQGITRNWVHRWCDLDCGQRRAFLLLARFWVDRLLQKRIPPSLPRNFSAR